MSDSNTSDSISDSGDQIDLGAQQPLQRLEDRGGELDMAAFLRQYGPGVDTRNMKSELDILREIPSFRNYVDKGMQFNYHFTEDSYALYSRVQNRMRLELTQFRLELSRRLGSRDRRLRINGYLYELGDVQDPYYRPEGYSHRGRAGSEGRRDGGRPGRREDRRDDRRGSDPRFERRDGFGRGGYRGERRDRRDPGRH